MYLSLLRDAKFYAFLHQVDGDLAAETRRNRCPTCGGALHSANYGRKPRGGPHDLGPGHDVRLSLCCAQEGCRKRRTPPSLRFLGRKVYLGAVVVVATAMQHGVTGRRVAEIEAVLGIGCRTLLRWRAWWRTIFTASATWRTARALLGASAVDTSKLPASLLERFAGDERAQLVGLLRFIAPVTTGSGF